MSIPSTQKQWVIQSTGRALDELVYQDASVPKLGQNEVLVKLRGASINFRDLLIPKVRASLVFLNLYLCHVQGKHMCIHVCWCADLKGVKRVDRRVQC